MLKKFIPNSLLGRSLIIVFVPVILIVLITAFVFYQTSWKMISKKLTQSVASDINVIIKLIDRGFIDDAIEIAQDDFNMKINLEKDKKINPFSIRPTRGVLSFRLQQALEGLEKPFFYDLNQLDQGAKIVVQLEKDLLIINVDRDRIFSGYTFVFLLWMVFSSLIIFFVAYLFMKGQIKPLKRLAIIAETFGRGLDAPEIKSSGALEVKQTTIAFNQMRDRIKKFFTQRTEMLAGVSHDLRTPLTRMKLQLSLMKDSEAKQQLEYDIDEMTKMLDSYLSFAKDEINADPVEEINFNSLIKEIINNNNISSKEIILNSSNKITSSGKLNQLKRCFRNLIENAIRYSDKIYITLSSNPKYISILIDDNGPGIPPEKYEEVFKPFITLDESRNKLISGSGLGLAISRDIIRSHGGEIILGNSKLGGLQVSVSIPA